MDGTRRYWTLVSVGATLAVLAVVFARPLLLYGAAGIGAVLVAQQVRFLRALRATDGALTVEQSVSKQYAKRDERTYVTLSARLARPSRLALRVEASLPTIADGPTGEERTVRLDPGTGSATATVEVSWPVVGRATFGPAAVTAEDEAGLFREELPRGPAPEVVVEPRVPRNVHVGEGGDRTVATYGGHRSDQSGSGLDPAELRQYVPGDSVSNIDWKATARLDYPHVREYEIETDRRTVLFVDHRAAMATGPAGETKLDYLREVALTFVGKAREVNDPLGLATVDDGGVTNWAAPSTDPDRYETVRTALHDLRGTGAGTPRAGREGARTRSPAAARRKAALLAGDDSAYSGRVAPFLAAREGYVQRMESEPLFGAVGTHLDRVAGSVWALVFTDDTDRRQLRETVKLARGRAAGVLLFLAPTVLYERDGLADLEAAYESYAEFESFRRDLTRLEGVHAFEVGPGDRIQAVLAAGRDRRR